MTLIHIFVDLPPFPTHACKILKIFFPLSSIFLEMWKNTLSVNRILCALLVFVTVICKINEIWYILSRYSESDKFLFLLNLLLYWTLLQLNELIFSCGFKYFYSSVSKRPHIF